MISGNSSPTTTTTQRTNRGRRVVFLILLMAVAVLALYRIFWYTPPSDHSITVKIFQTEGGWGYDVRVGGNVYIHQPFVPGVIGRKPFPTRQTALRAAKTVKAKMLHGQVPALTKKDRTDIGLDSLGNVN